MWPAWDCGPGGGSCRRVEKDWNAGCPKCELSEQAPIFHANTEQEVKRVLGKWPDGYDFVKMRDLVAVVSNAQSANPDRIDPDMDLTFSRLVEVLQQERNLADRLERMRSNA